MIPIRDTTPTRNVPVVNNGLIAINVLVFILEALQGSTGERFIFTYGLVPARYTLDHIARHFSLFHQAFAWLSFMFLHGGIWHLVSNMWFLHIFGDNVEDQLGPARYLLFYLCCGLVSGLSHFLLHLHSLAPVIGASGAVAGVMGGYFLLHPRSRILTLVPILIIPFFFEIPAFFFLGFWFFLQFINAAASAGTVGGVAWWAHVGGFLCGMLLLKLISHLPSVGLTQHIRQATLRKKTHRLQVARPTSLANDPDLYAIVTVSPYEALVGSRKMVTIQHSLQRRIFNVIIPPGITAGKILRLRGQGKTSSDGRRGDLLLKIVIQ